MWPQIAGGVERDKEPLIYSRLRDACQFNARPIAAIAHRAYHSRLIIFEFRANHFVAPGYSCALSTFVNVMESTHEFAA